LLYGSNGKDQPMHRVIYLSGDLEYCPQTGVWASEFHEEWKHWNDTYRVETGRHMLEKPAPKKVVQHFGASKGKSCEFKSQPRYASDIDSSWFRRAYGPPDYIEELDGTDHNISRNLLDT